MRKPEWPANGKGVKNKLLVCDGSGVLWSRRGEHAGYSICLRQGCVKQCGFTVTAKVTAVMWMTRLRQLTQLTCSAKKHSLDHRLRMALVDAHRGYYHRTLSALSDRAEHLPAYTQLRRPSPAQQRRPCRRWHRQQYQLPASWKAPLLQPRWWPCKAHEPNWAPNQCSWQE